MTILCKSHSEALEKACKHCDHLVIYGELKTCDHCGCGIGSRSFCPGPEVKWIKIPVLKINENYVNVRHEICSNCDKIGILEKQSKSNLVPTCSEINEELRFHIEDENSSCPLGKW